MRSSARPAASWWPRTISPRVHDAIGLIFEHRDTPDFSEPPTLAHGRIEQRAIWTTTRINDYPDFPGIGQVFAIERRVAHKKSGKTSAETVFGLTSHVLQTASVSRLLH